MATTTESGITQVWQLLKRLIILAISAYLLYRVRTILISVLIAILLTYALLPVVEWLCKRRIGTLRPKTQRLMATIVVFIAFIAITTFVITLMVTPFKHEVNEFVKNLGVYTTEFGKLLKSAGTWYTRAVPADVKELIGNMDFSSLTGRISHYSQELLNATTSWIGFALELILIPVLAFYFVLDYRSLTRELYGLVPTARLKETVRINRDVGEILQSYIVGQLILCTIAGILTGLFLWAVGMPYVVVLALFAAITRAIPVVGPVISGVPIILVALLNFPGLAMALYILAFIVVMHFAESKFILPHLIGERMHLHPASVIIVLLIGAEFFGVVGMFFAAPVAAIIRELIRLYYIIPRERERKAELRRKQAETAAP